MPEGISEDPWSYDITSDDEILSRQDNQILSELDEDSEDEVDRYDSPENLVYETIPVESKSSMQVNLTKLMAQHIIVGQWNQVQSVMKMNK